MNESPIRTLALLSCLVAAACGEVSVVNPAPFVSDGKGDVAGDVDSGGAVDADAIAIDAVHSDVDAATADSDAGDAIQSDAADADTGVADVDAVANGDADADTAADVTGDTTDAGSDTTDAVVVTTCKAKVECTSEKLPLCALPAGKCVACLYDGTCPGPYGRCHQDACLPPRTCTTDAECAAEQGVCGAHGFCADCVTSAQCNAGEVCTLFQCLPAPKACGAGADCGATAQICGNAGVCVDCDLSGDCPAGVVCASGLCTPPLCTSGDAICIGPSTKGVCAPGGAGWGANPCDQGQGCELGQCKSWVCVPGTKACAGSFPTSCPADGLDWQLGEQCKATEACVDGVCTNEVCQTGATQCTASGALQTCNAKKTGWVDSKCPEGQACSGGACLNIVCEPQSSFCIGDTLWNCNGVGTSKTFSSDCSTGGGFCAEGACLGLPCIKGTTLCKGEAVASCADDGASWKIDACVGSDGDKCIISACDSTAKACKAGAKKTCDDGNACTTGTCTPNTGDCAQAPAEGTCDDGDGCTSGDVCVASACVHGGASVSTFSGSKIPGHLDGVAAVARFAYPTAAARTAQGTLVVADRNGHRLRSVAINGDVSTFAGNGTLGFADGPALSAMMASPSDVAASQGWVIFSDLNNQRIRRVTPAGVVATLAGNGSAGDLDGKGDAAQFYNPTALAVDGKGNVFVVEPSRHRIRRVAPDGVVTTVAGSPTAGSANGKGVLASFSSPAGIAVAADGTLYVADRGNRLIRAITADGVVTTLAGAGAAGNDDGEPAKATFSQPWGLAIVSPGALDGGVDGALNLIISDFGGSVLRRYRGGAAPTVDTVAGVVGKIGSGDGPALSAQFQTLHGIWAEPDGVGVCDVGVYALRKLTRSKKGCDDGESCTIDACDAKSGQCTYKMGKAGAACDDGSACTSADACAGTGGCVGKAKSCDDNNACTADICDPWLGTCLVLQTTSPCDDGNACTLADHCTDGKCVGGGGWIETVAGNGAAGIDDGVGLDARFYLPGRMAAPFGSQGASKAPAQLYLSDRDAHLIRRVTPATWAVETVAGSTGGYLDGALATARFSLPEGLAVAKDGAILVADAGNHRLRTISIDAGAGPLKGSVKTFAGDGVAGLTDGPAATARFKSPEDVVVDAAGTVYVADAANRVLRRVQAGVVSTLAGSGTIGSLDGDAAVARFAWPTSLLLDGEDLFVADRDNHRIRRVDLKKLVVTTWLGGGQSAWQDGIATQAAFSSPVGISVGGDGRWWLVSQQGSIAEVRASKAGQGALGIKSSPRLTRLVGLVGGGFTDGPLIGARLNQPRGILSVGKDLLIGDGYNRRLRLLTAGAPACTQDAAACSAVEICDPGSGSCKVVTAQDGDTCGGGSCAVGVCKAGACANTAPPKCDDGKPCTLDACDVATGACSFIVNGADANCCVPVPWLQSFESDVKLDVDPAVAGIAWQAQAPVEPVAATDGKGALKFGAPGDAKLSGGAGGVAVAMVRLGAQALPKGTALVLELDVLFDLNVQNTSSRVNVRLRHGASTTTVSAVYANKLGWQKLQVDVSGLAGKSVEVELQGQLALNALGTGIWVDNVRFTAACKAKTCTSPGSCNQVGFGCMTPSCGSGVCDWTDNCCESAAACDDGKVCTVDACNNGNCSHSPIAGCCEKADDCKDSDVCLAATCPVVGGSCQWSGVAGCCNTDASCDDDKPCTKDVCSSKNTCSHNDICCKAVGDCSDGDACTIESCVEGFCQWTYKTDAGCCIPVQDVAGFETAKELSGWTREACTAGSALPAGCTAQPWASPTKGWQQWAGSTLAHAGAGVLYYGDPAAKNFNFGNASAQIARSPAYVVQPGTSTFEAWLWWDVESPANYDRIQIYPVVDGVRMLTAATGSPSFGAAWYKAMPNATATKTWTKAAVDVSAYTGKKVALEIYFNTVDSVGNSGLGVLVDDVRLVATCGK